MVEMVKTVHVVGETHVLWIQYGDKLTQTIQKNGEIVWQKYKIGINTYVKDATGELAHGSGFRLVISSVSMCIYVYHLV
jgi:hypothetical protein